MKGEGRGGQGEECCPLQLGTLDPAVEEGREGRRAKKGACVGASKHFFFPLKHRPIRLE